VVPVLGLRPGRRHAITLALTDADGRTASAGPFEIATPPVPDDFPTLDVRISHPARMEPGVTMIPLMRWTAEGPDRGYGLVLGLDAAGEIVWWYRTDHVVNEVERRLDGDLVYTSGRTGLLFQVDMLGNVVRRWHTTGIAKDDVPASSIPIATDTLHHDFCFLPDGRFLALGSEARRMPDYPTSHDDPAAPREESWVIGDLLLEFDRAGTVHRTWKLLDLLDPYRVADGSTSTGFWKEVYEKRLDSPGKDWAHANSLALDPRDGSAVVSLNHQSAVFKMDLATSRIRWILGDHAGWNPPWQEHLLTPVGELEWPANQHAADVTPNGTILLFDNGSRRGPPFGPDVPVEQKYSRVVEYAVDEAKGEVRQVFAYGGPGQDRFYSPFLCDVDLLPRTGNLWVTDGGAGRDAGGQDSDNPGDAHRMSHFFELEKGTGRKVFELWIDDPRAGWATYRSERFADLLPPFHAADP
jgi:hypothetical protein